MPQRPSKPPGNSSAGSRQHFTKPPLHILDTCFDERTGGLSGFRAGLESVCHIDLLDSKSNFWARAREFNLGAAILTEMQGCSLRYLRGTQHIARAAYDHFQIHLSLAGESQVQSGRQSVTFREGDIGITDTLRASDTQVLQTSSAPTHSLAIFVPRRELAQLLPSPDHGHCSVIRRETPIGRLLAEHILSLKERFGRPANLDAGAGVRDLVALLADGLRASADAISPIREANRRAALSAVTRYIEHNLDSPELSAATISRHFGYSRATLYRLFEPEAGLANYISRRRLHRAFGVLIAPRRTHRNILDVAIEGDFASDATFSRAFRREFGLPPGEVRSLALAWRADTNARDEPRDSRERTLALSWIRRLGLPDKKAI